MAELAGSIRQHQCATQTALLVKLDPVVRGWSNYYKTACSAKTYSTCDHQLWQKLWSWATRRHPMKNHHWIARKYWHTRGSRRWVFGTEDHSLRTHQETKISRHVKVIGSRSPYDGDQVYFKFIGVSGCKNIPHCPRERRLYSNDNAGNALSVERSSEIGICWRSTILFRAASGAKSNTAIGNSCIDIATTPSIPHGHDWYVCQSLHH